MAEGGAQAPGAPSLDTPLPLKFARVLLMKQKMACVETRSRGRKCLGRVYYFESADLYLMVFCQQKKAVIEVIYMLYLLRPRRAGQSQHSKN